MEYDFIHRGGSNTTNRFTLVEARDLTLQPRMGPLARMQNLSFYFGFKLNLYLECRQNLTHFNGWTVESLSIV